MNKKNLLLGVIALFLIGNYGIDITQYVYDDSNIDAYEAAQPSVATKGGYVAKVIYVKESSNPPYVDRIGPVDLEFEYKPSVQDLENTKPPLLDYKYDTTLYVIAVRKSPDVHVEISKEKENPEQ